MIVFVETPNSRVIERQYIFGVLLDEFLGISWESKVVERVDVRITVLDQPGEVRLPDMLFSLPDNDWLTSQSMPPSLLPCWNSGDLGLDLTLIDPILPVIYGDHAPHASRQDASVCLPVDIFGSAFFMLTRYEELVTPDRDEHSRFPAWASLAYKQSFLERPIIDEYVEILWATMQYLWPGLERKYREFAVKLSHDIDRPSRYGFKKPLELIRVMAGDVIKRHDFASALSGPWIRCNTKYGLHAKDPYNIFDWIMDISEDNCFKSAFYFIAGKTVQSKDADYEIDHPAIRALMRRIHQRGHEIGLHPSYGTYKSPSLITLEADRLRRICAEERIVQSAWGGRMHYLRWETPGTMQGLEQAAMTYDSTLGYADHVGFRCGTCHEYTAFDLSRQQALRLRIRPLVAMDGSLFSAQYMALEDLESVHEKLSQIKTACKHMKGNFTLLWHNSELTTPERKTLYETMVAT